MQEMIDDDGGESWSSRPVPPSLTTLRDLRASGWTSLPVAEELRRNVVRRLSSGQQVVDGLVGYEDTVLPALANALLAGHDVILLGERGQAKTRILRSLVGLLDEWIPVIDGSEINDDPYRPVSRYARDLVAASGEDTPIAWVHRDDRYAEKLATPDTAIADLIGEVDPIRVAEGRYLSDELTLHYGLVPRVNRGIFAINELPDLAERIQVGLLNLLEERDIQIRGHRIRLPIDVLLVASANPEDYTNRGRIITPLKDRFGTQVRTHYPLTVADEIMITRQEAMFPAVEGVSLLVPDFMEEIVVRITQLARRSQHVNQSSGVSVRASIAGIETVAANAMRRAVALHEHEASPRISDLEALGPSLMGKIELESLEEGDEVAIVEALVATAVLDLFRERCPAVTWKEVVDAFDSGAVVQTGDDVPVASYKSVLAGNPGLRVAASHLLTRGEGAGEPGEVSLEGESPALVASAMELVLEGLHLAKRLNKDSGPSRRGIIYMARPGSGGSSGRARNL